MVKIVVEDLKSLRDTLLRSVNLGKSTGDDDRGSNSKMDINAAKELLGSLFSWAGKGKNEFVQILGREVGGALAAFLKEPINKLLSGQKLQITFELLAKDSHPHRNKAQHERAPTAPFKKRRSKPSPRGRSSGKVDA